MKENTPNIEFRAARAEDLEKLVTLRISAMKESLEAVGRFDPVRARNRLIRDFEIQYTECVFDGQTIVGFRISKVENKEIILKHLYVDPKYQNRGIGKSILRRIIKQGEAEKRTIRLISLKESRANRFYLKNGFKHLDSIKYDNVYMRQCSKDCL